MINTMFPVLEGLCRHNENFANFETLQEERQNLDKPGKYSFEQRQAILRAEAEDALGPKSQPDYSLLTPALMDKLDAIYCEVFCPATDPATPEGVPHPYELQFAHTEVEGTSWAEHMGRIVSYRNSVAALLQNEAIAAEENANISPKRLEIMKQMPGKVLYLIEGYNAGVSSMPIMPLMTKSALRMVLTRFDAVCDALIEVSLRC
jgi:hypothetical protein